LSWEPAYRTKREDFSKRSLFRLTGRAKTVSYLKSEETLMHMKQFIFIFSVALFLSADTSSLCQEDVFSTPRPVNNDAAFDGVLDGQPMVAGDGNGVWVVAWLRQAGHLASMVMVARSEDDGQTWSDPIRIDSGAAQYYPPRLSPADNGVWLAAWPLAGAPAAVAKSVDNGRSWSVPVFFDRECFNVQTLPLGNSEWLLFQDVFWTETPTTGDIDIVGMRSFDDGDTWGAPYLINPNALEDDNFPFGEDSNPELSVVTNDKIGMAWTWNGFSSGGPGFSKSFDKGVTWSEMILPYDGSGTVECLKGNDQGNWSLIFRASTESFADFYFISSTDDGLTWSQPNTVTNFEELTNNALLTFDIGGRQDDLWIVVWNSSNILTNETGLDSDIFYAESDNFGLSWAEPKVISQEFLTDNNYDIRPSIFHDEKKWMIVWASGRPDGDIYFSIREDILPTTSGLISY
jgi:hypothetical protein